MTSIRSLLFPSVTALALLAGCQGASGAAQASSPLPAASSVTAPGSARTPTAAPRPAATPITAAALTGAKSAAAHALAGTVGDKSVQGDVLWIGDTLVGTYSYGKEQLRRIRLDGSSAGDQVTITESVHGKATGAFKGTRGPDGSLEGTWTSADGARKLPFALKATPAALPDTLTFRVVARQGDIDRPVSNEFPVANVVYTGELVLFEPGKKARRLGSLGGEVGGACEFGERAEQTNPTDGAFGADRKKLRAGYEAAHRDEKILAFDVLYSGCNRGIAWVYVTVVVERPDGSRQARVFSGGAGDDSIDFAAGKPELQITL